MAKKNSSRASRKNRKGAAGKANAASTGERRAIADFRLFHSIDEGMPLFNQTMVEIANHHIENQNQSLESKEQERLLKKMDTIYNKDVKEWALTLYTQIITGEFYSLGSSMNAVFDRLVFLVKNAISATKKKDVLIEGMDLHMIVHIMCTLMHVMYTDEEEILDLMKSLTNEMRTVTDTHFSKKEMTYTNSFMITARSFFG